MNRHVVQFPLITEKATDLGKTGTYVFLVSKNTTKPEIKKDIKILYKVDAEKVRIINVKNKSRRLGSTMGTKPGYKKALVTLKEGQKLDILPQ